MAAPNNPQDDVLEWARKDNRRFLRANIRVGDLDRTIQFYTQFLGMKVLSRKDFPEQKYSTAVVGFGPEETHFVIGLTHNHDAVDKLDLGAGFDHFGIVTQDIYATVEKIQAAGGVITREPGPVAKGGNTIFAFVKDPNGYSFELILRPSTPEPLCQICLLVTDIDRAIDFYKKALGMNLLMPKYGIPQDQCTVAMVGYGSDFLQTTIIELKYKYNVKEYTKGNGYAMAGGQEEGEEGSKGRCWQKLLDLEEAKKQVLFSLPTILTNLLFSSITLVSVMFAGHLGELHLAGATLANSWANVTGFAFVVGLSGALETLCGQGFGAKSYRMLGIYLQASCIISFLFCSIISIIWLYTEPILILLHQDPQISKSAALFLKFLIPGLFAHGLLQNILRFLQTQSVYVMPMVISMISIIIHIGITYGLVHWTALGFKGAPLAASVSLWISVLMLAFNVCCGKNFEHTWEGFSLESFNYIINGLKLALPSATMECLEEWAFEILVFVGGLMPNSRKTTSLLAMCVNTQEIGYMVTYGLSATASTRVSNELGEGNPDGAKNAMLVTLKLSVILSFTIVLALTFGHNTWAGFFIDSTSSYAVLIEEFASMIPLLAISIIVDSLQGVFSGVARGCGWQHLAVYVNLGTFYLIGMTIAGLLGFKLKLYAKGLWIGLICGLSCQASTLLLITQLKKWTRSDLSHNDEGRKPSFGV